MKHNVGKTDKIIRVIVGVIGLALGYYVSPWFYLLAVAGFATAVFGFCMLYTLFGINTCPVEGSKKKENSETSAQAIQEEGNSTK